MPWMVIMSIENLNILTNIISSIFLPISVTIAVISIILDHKRRIIQSTIEYYHKMTDELKESSTSILRENIENHYKNDSYIKINSTDSFYLENKKIIIKWFETLEEFAVAIKKGVYNLKMYMDCEGRALVVLFDYLYPIFIDRRKGDGCNNRYTELFKIYNKIKIKYKKIDKKSSKKKNKRNLIWYVAYGSNLCRDRFMIYINGGFYNVNNQTYDGCRDKTPPLKDKPFLIPHELYFGYTSSYWENKGVAFIDADKSGVTLGRAFLITEEQFYDIQKQEGATDDWYGRIVNLVNTDDNIPCKSFTSKKRHKTNIPSEKYVEIISRGLSETYPQLKYCNKEIT